MDGGIVVGYVTAWLFRGARQLADSAVESLLDRLARLVERRLGHRPIDALEQRPHDAETRNRVGASVAEQARRDPTFARELSQLVAELDRRGARQIINQVNAQVNLQAFDHGIVVGRDYNVVDVPDPSDLSGAPVWVKLFLALGAAVCVTGLFIFGYTMFTDTPDLSDPSSFGDVPRGIPLAAGVFFAGFLITGIGTFGRAMSKRR
jgi:hypothetical protein